MKTPAWILIILTAIWFVFDLICENWTGAALMVAIFFLNVQTLKTIREKL